MDTADLVVDSLAAYRLTRLIVDDTITEPARRRIAEALPPDPESGRPHWLVGLLSCSWCAGWWVTVACMAVRQSLPSWWRPAARLLAVAALVGIVSEHT